VSLHSLTASIHRLHSYHTHSGSKVFVLVPVIVIVALVVFIVVFVVSHGQGQGQVVAKERAGELRLNE
jgi:hypothetical protein